MQFAGPAFTFPLNNEQLDKSLSDPNRFAFKAVDLHDMTTVGHGEIYLGLEYANLGRIIIGDPQKKGHGLGYEIVSHLLDYAFDTLGQVKAELNVFDWNLGAIKCYEKAGFSINPHKKAERTVNGQTWIALTMTIDKRKWKYADR